MAAAFSYRPKFVDIRVNKPDKAARARAPQERACDHVGCQAPGEHRAPKSRQTGAPPRPDQFWHFCAQHAADYNRRWDFFRDMSAAEQAAFQKAEEVGHRPTWSFKAARGDRVSATRFWQAARPGDSYGLFTGGEAPAAAPRPERRISRLQALALDVLALEENADGPAIRARYAELVKRYHPDSNGGDRSAEAQLNKVIKAYQTLKAAGLA